MTYLTTLGYLLGITGLVSMIAGAYAAENGSVLIGYGADAVNPYLALYALRQARVDGRISDSFQILQMTMCVAGFAFCSGPEYGCYVVVTFNISLGGEIQVTAVGLRFTGKRIFQIAFCLTSFQIHDMTSKLDGTWAFARILD